jgi:plasmid stabilization system protein ParE
MLTSSLDFHEETAAEYDSAFDWYLQRSPDAAQEFDAEVHRAISEITKNPERWAAGSSNTRRFLLRKFPFGLSTRKVLHKNCR